jgi:hypothetical protein
MTAVQAAPVLLSLIVGMVLGFITWGSLRHGDRAGSVAAQPDLVIGLLVLAAFALGVFLAYSLVALI